MDQMLWLLVTLLLIGALSLSYLHRRWRRLPPGPMGFPIVGSLPSVGPTPHLSLHALSRTYGPIMHLRLGSVPTVVVSSAEAAEHFVRGSNDAAFANRPPSEVFACISYGLKGFAFAEHGPYWRHLRRICVTHLLSAQKVSSFRSSRGQELQLFVKALGEAAKSGHPVNVSAALAELVANMVCRMIMGRKFESGDEDGERFQKLTKDLMGLIGAFNVNDFIPVLGIFDVQGMRRRMRKVHEEFDALLEKILDEHSERKKRKKNENNNREKPVQEEEEDEHEKDFVDVMLEFMDKDGRDNQVEGVQFDRTTVKAIVLVSS